MHNNTHFDFQVLKIFLTLEILPFSRTPKKNAHIAEVYAYAHYVCIFIDNIHIRTLSKMTNVISLRVCSCTEINCYSLLSPSYTLWSHEQVHDFWSSKLFHGLLKTQYSYFIFFFWKKKGLHGEQLSGKKKKKACLIFFFVLFSLANSLGEEGEKRKPCSHQKFKLGRGGGEGDRTVLKIYIFMKNFSKGFSPNKPIHRAFFFFFNCSPRLQILNTHPNGKRPQLR